jgi:hypothetical protein
MRSQKGMRDPTGIHGQKLSDRAGEILAAIINCGYDVTVNIDHVVSFS